MFYVTLDLLYAVNRHIDKLINHPNAFSFDKEFSCCAMQLVPSPESNCADDELLLEARRQRERNYIEPTVLCALNRIAFAIMTLFFRSYIIISVLSTSFFEFSRRQPHSEKSREVTENYFFTSFQSYAIKVTFEIKNIKINCDTLFFTHNFPLLIQLTHFRVKYVKPRLCMSIEFYEHCSREILKFIKVAKSEFNLI